MHNIATINTYMDQTINLIETLITTLLRSFKDLCKVIRLCTKPDHREFRITLLATTVGFLIMGFLGYIIKLLHIPITNIIVG